MLLKNHIGYRFLTDDNVAMEIVEGHFKEEYRTIKVGDEIPEKFLSVFHLVNRKDQKAYYITETVLDKLNMLKIKMKHTEGIGEHYDWTVFSEVKNGKYTFVLPTNKLIRMLVTDDVLSFCYLTFEHLKGNKDLGYMSWIMFYVNRKTGEQCDHFNHSDVKRNQQFIYYLLCFMFLSDNDEIVVEPNRKYGTKKSGKIINTLNIPLTVVNSRWNTTVISNEAFMVSGHYALRWIGEGRQKPRMVFIEPFEKSGYTRKAQNDLISK